MTQLDNYRKYFGDIIFPNMAEKHALIKHNPSSYLYSEDGLRWHSCPSDLHGIKFLQMLFMKRPEGVILDDMTEFAKVKREPQHYERSTNNGQTWMPCLKEHDVVAVYNNSTPGTWFRRIRHS